ncbi:hypothetical protein K4749_11950 [Streptomyces sp. TRM72054]|uniref:hypothetical protein n=1 Tax=Streptomyces sp. TRM72054 TaxID=2870562 RepID=UPI001C8C4421|nr:hypothetical protein [Streptomyces sp. TRM72054]MBX9394292.1 hypothetical protein [Streptomyces sp. TRM72054]
MIVTLIIVCEVGFWVLLAAGLFFRYVLRMRRTGLGLLLLEPLLEVVLLVATAIDLKNGADPSWKHGLAALYIGYTVGHGHRTVKWLDGHAAHRFGGAAPPVKPPRYGMARARHEGRVWLGSAVGAAVASVLLLIARWYVDDPSRTGSLESWILTAWRAAGIHGLIALSYAVWPKRAPREEASALPARDPQHVTDVLVGRPGQDEKQVR